MSIPISKPSRVSIEEYLRQEENSTQRHEYHNGEILMMAGGSYQHSVIITNALVGIQSRLKGKPCRASEANTRVSVASRSTYAYPDITVVCGEPMFDPADVKQTTITNPTLIVEVISDSTGAYDLGEKFSNYRSCETLKQYVLISTREARVDTYLRRNDGTWLFKSLDGLQAEAQLTAIGISLPLAEVYDGIKFEPEQPSPT